MMQKLRATLCALVCVWAKRLGVALKLPRNAHLDSIRNPWKYIVLALSLAANATMANATTYNIALLEKIGAWDSFETWAYPSQINELGTIVGTIESCCLGNVTAVKWENQKVTRLPWIGWGSEAHAITNANTIVGAVVSMDEGARGPAVWKDGVLKVLDTLYGPWEPRGHYHSSPNAYAYAINDAGIIVGESLMATSDDRRRQATLWNGSDVVGLMGPDGPAQVANGINNSNDIIGNSGNGRAIVWQNGIPRYLDMLPGGTRTFLIRNLPQPGSSSEPVAS